MQIHKHPRPPLFNIREHLLTKPHLLNQRNIGLLSEIFGGPDEYAASTWDTTTPKERNNKYTVIMAAFEIPADYRPTYQFTKAIRDIAYNLEAVVTRKLAVGAVVRSRRNRYEGPIVEISDNFRILVKGRRNLCSARDFDRVE